jgi:hypothetical protein
MKETLVTEKAEVPQAVEAKCLLFERPSQSFRKRAQLVVVADPVSEQDPDLRFELRRLA